MQFKLICVGKAKGAYLELSREYEKRIGRYARLSVREVPEAKYQGSPNEAEIAQLLQREAAAIRRELAERWYTVALDARGESLSSEQLARRLDDLAVGGTSAIAFVMGGSLGLAEELKKGADMLLSLSAMTYPHQLARVVLLEQLYRAMTILRGEPYHK